VVVESPSSNQQGSSPTTFEALKPASPFQWGGIGWKTFFVGCGCES